MMESRARQLGGIYARHGASVRIGQVVSGPYAGCIVLARGYADFRAAAKAFQAINTDPAHAEFWREREANPAGDLVIARDIYRTVYGEHAWGTHPLSHLRQYELTRDNLAAAVKLLAEAHKIVSKAGVNVVGSIPIAGENLSTLSVSYQFRSTDHWGEALDTVGTSEAFQALVAKAAKLGTLRASGMVIPL
jgi:hypothetical protein